MGRKLHLPPGVLAKDFLELSKRVCAPVVLQVQLSQPLREGVTCGWGTADGSGHRGPH